MRLAISRPNRRLDFRDVGIGADEMMRDAHVVEDRFDDAHAIAVRFTRRQIRIVLQQPNHHADRLLVFDGDAADGVDRVEKAGVLDQDQGALVAIG